MNQLSGSARPELTAGIGVRGSIPPPVAKPRRMIHSIAWTGAATWTTRSLNWVATIAAARILSPADFGLVGMANVLLGLALVVSECGLGAAVIAMPDMTSDEVSQMNTISIAAGCVLWLLLSLAGHPFALFFHAPKLQPVILAMSVPFLITSFKIIPDALLQREFQFKRLAFIQSVEAVAYATSLMAAAFLGAGYWSLVLAAIVGPSFSTCATLYYRRHHFAWPRISALRPFLTFSWHVLCNRVAWYAYSNADFLVAGRVLGQAALGAYTVAWNISNIPLQRVTDLVTRVLPSYFSSAQKDDATLRRYVLNLTQGLLLLTLPASIGLCIAADDLIPATIGVKWMPAVLPLRILALYIAVRSITTLFAPLLNVRGESRFVMWNNVAAALYFPPAFYLASHWGTSGIALVWPLLYPVVALPLYVRVFRQIHLDWNKYWASARPAVSGTVLMALGLLLLRHFLPPSFGLYSRVAVQVSVGALIYFVTVVGLHHKQLQGLFAVVRERRGANAS